MAKNLKLPKVLGLLLGSVLVCSRILAQQVTFSNSIALPSSGLGTAGGFEGEPFSLGLEFTVYTNIIVTALGAYDETIGGSGAGFGSEVIVGIYNESSGAFVGPSATFAGTTGTVIDSYRFQNVTNFNLPPGTYMIVAAGLGIPTAPLWNEGWAQISPNPIQFNNANGAMALGKSYYASAPIGSLVAPNNVDAGPNPQYAAGSFEFMMGTVTNSSTTTFNFTIDEASKTSAGVYLTNGTLIRTLWSKVRYQPGTFSATWNGLDDNGNAVTNGIYEIKVLQHNTEYVWDGAIGNTSAEISGPTVHKGFYPIRDMTISGSNIFSVSGYDEGMYDFHQFTTNDPQHLAAMWYWVYSAQFNRNDSVPGDIYDLDWRYIASDSNRVYFAATASPNQTNVNIENGYPGCIVSCNVADNSQANFTYGTQIVNNGANTPLPNGIFVGTQPGLTGLAVQKNGNLLAASVAPDNKVYLMDKTSGASLGNFSVTAPGRMDFAQNGSLWVVTSNSVICYTNLTNGASASVVIPNFSEPLDVGVSTVNTNLILVADGGSSQQIKAFTASGAPLWTYGQLGGYQANGPAVATNKFWFFDGEQDGTYICFAPDGSFWIGDGANTRNLHFTASCSYIEQLMYQPNSLLAAIDQNNISRVFNGFLEFSVDYTKPLQQSWTLVNNWRANVPECNISYNAGVREVTTFSNGRTYALIDNNCAAEFTQQELCELVPGSGLRLTGIYPMVNEEGRWISLGPDGSARASTYGACRWYESTLSGFDANNNPVWNPEFLLASASQNPTDPVPRGGSFGNIRTTISTNNVLIAFDQSLNNGFHLGGITVGATNWLWRASPAGQWMNGQGIYENDNGVQYAGNTMQAIDRQVVYGYHGEFFRSVGQACQFFHYYDDGLFVGQFGEANVGHSPYEGALPASAGNAQCPSLLKTTNGDYYLWSNDESSHGPQRWHLSNARTIREIIGYGALGSTITLTNQIYSFPTVVTGKNGNQSCQLSWQPVQGATSYNVRYSFMNGGPYSFIAGSTTNLSYVSTGLTNGQTYYFAVTAIVGGAEGVPSEQVAIYPFDTTQNVISAGSMTEGGQTTPIVDIASAAPALGQTSYLGSEQDTGTLNPRELDDYGYGNLQYENFGASGYVLYDWAGLSSYTTNLVGSTTVTPAGGWTDYKYLERQYRVDNTLGINDGLLASPSGYFDIGVTDTNYHYLTVISPDQFNDPRQFTMSLTSTNNSMASFSVNEPIGYSHVFQFLFRGNVTLSASGNNAIVQAIFLDNAPVSFATNDSSTVSGGGSNTVIDLTAPKILPNGEFQFSFTSSLSKSFTILSSTNISLSLSNWTVIGTPINTVSNLYQFTFRPATNEPRRFFAVRAQ